MVHPHLRCTPKSGVDEEYMQLTIENRCEKLVGVHKLYRCRIAKTSEVEEGASRRREGLASCGWVHHQRPTKCIQRYMQDFSNV